MTMASRAASTNTDTATATQVSADHPAAAGGPDAEMPASKLPSRATAATAAALTIDPNRARTLHAALSSVLIRVHAAAAAASSPERERAQGRRKQALPRLVAVSKLKPASDILALHQEQQQQQQQSANIPNGNNNSSAAAAAGQLHFGENYVQELLEKARILPRSIRWHMIGGLQSNKCRDLAKQIPNLWAVESVDSIKKAGLLNKGRSELATPNTDGNKAEGGGRAEKLRIFVQVNTSGEASKSGVPPPPPPDETGEEKGDKDEGELVKLCRYIRDECPYLHLQGLMTIGAIGRSRAAGAAGPDEKNEDFECLRRARDRVEQALLLRRLDSDSDSDSDLDRLELSMGMSQDFEAAILQGSDEVRVGTGIFGARPPKGSQLQQYST